MPQHEFAARNKETHMKVKTRGVLALVSLLLSAGTAAALEAKMYAVTTWNADCGGSTRNSWDNMVEDWYNDITNSGRSFFGFNMSGHCSNAYFKDGKMVNGNLVNSRFADPSQVSWGNEHNRMGEGNGVRSMRLAELLRRRYLRHLAPQPPLTTSSTTAWTTSARWPSR